MAESTSETYRVVVAGGSGFIGHAIRRELQRNTRVTKVYVIGRTKPALLNGAEASKAGDLEPLLSSAAEAREIALTWDDLEREGLPDCEAVISVTGSNLAEAKFDEAGMKLMKDSRIEPVRKLIRLIQKAKKRPSVFITTSGTALYPTNKETGDTVHDESFQGPFTKNPLMQEVAKFEGAGFDDLPAEVRRVIIRVGSCLGTSGGILGMSKLPWGLGYVAKYGDGTAPIPWVHERDCARLFLHPIFNPKVEGTLLAVADDSSTQNDYAAALAKVTNKWVWSVPAFLIRWFIAPVASVLLEGARVRPRETIEKHKFQFLFRDLESALKDLILGSS